MTISARKRPDSCTEEHLDYLDKLRESGITNMLDAAYYLRRDFLLPEVDARVILGYWIMSFSERHP